LQENIYIIGMPGSGKSTWGKRLANALNYDFVDLDTLIEQQKSSTIEQIFSEKGEDFFRELERKILHQTTHFTHTIIACGGGTPCFFDNMNWINSNGKSIYFKANVSLILNRIEGSKAQRPLFLGMSRDEMKEKIEELLSIRNPFYLEANVHINLPIKSLKDIVNQIFI
jgi:shikimate kinase